MKSTSQSSISPARRALFAASLALVCSAPALAQTSGTSGSTNASASQKNPPADYGATGSPHRTNQSQPTTATGSGYHSGTASADADAAREINAQNGTADLSPTGRDTMSRDKLSWGDRRFVNNAAEDGKAEVQLAELAAQRASHAEVKSFAQKLVDGHTKMNSELMTIAGQKNVKIDDDDDDKNRAYKRLSKKSGLEFDQEFVEHTVDEHEKCIRMFEKASTDAKDSEVRAFAAKHLESLRGHLQEAQSLRQAVMPTGRMDANSGRGATPAGPTSIDTDATPATGTNASSRETESSVPAPKPDTRR